MLRHAQTVHDGSNSGLAVHLGRSHQIALVDAADILHALRHVIAHRGGHDLHALGAFVHEIRIVEAFAQDHVHHAVGESHVGARAQLQVNVRLRGQPDVARVHHDQTAPAFHRSAYLHADDRMGFLGVRSHQHDHVGFVHHVFN